MANKWFANLTSHERDFKRLSELSFPFEKVSLLGGEPLLHPQVTEFLKVTRDFVSAKIQLVTNGLLLAKMENVFWEECRAQDIVIKVSGYPSLKVEWAQKLASQHGVEIEDVPKEEMRIRHFNRTEEDGSDKMKQCNQAYCNNLLEGRLYPCPSGAYVHFLNTAFQCDFPQEKGFDIHAEDATKESILAYLNSPIDLCKYCNLNKDFAKWCRSERVLDEWVRPPC
jgi:hypothetical protein